MKRFGAGVREALGRAASFAAAMLAVLTLTASGGFHDLLHADEPASAAAEMTQLAASKTLIAAVTAEKAGSGRSVPIHACSGHCAAHSATQAPLMSVIPAPLMVPAAWKLDSGDALHRYASGGPERPPRA